MDRALVVRLVIVTVGIALAAGCRPRQETADVEPFALAARPDVLFPQSYVGGDITTAVVIDDEIIFADASTRSIGRVEVREGDTSNVYPLSGHGDGPGEYRLPGYLALVGDSLVAFSDVTNQTIKVIEPNGTEAYRLHHTQGGGRRFAYADGRFFVQGVRGDRLTVYSINGESTASYFPISAEQQLIGRVIGGGVTVAGDRVYAMNGLEPSIVVFATGSDTAFEIRPGHWKSLPNWEVLDGTFEELDERLGELPMFFGLETISIDDRDIIVVVIREGDTNRLELLDTDGSLLQTIHDTAWVIGSHNSTLLTLRHPSAGFDLGPPVIGVSEIRVAH